MKKHLRLAALLMACALIFCACGGSANNNSSNNSNNSNEADSGFVFDRSKGLDERGYWEGIKASDYVTIPDLTTVTISKAELQKEIDTLLAEYPNTVNVTDRAVKDGDTINIDYTGKVDGVAFDGGSTNGEGTDVVVGSGRYVDNMLERLAGHMPGETFDMEVVFPDPYESNTELSGKTTVFTITINYIIEPVETVWNNQFVTENLADYGWDNTEKAEADILASLKEDAVLAAATFNKDVPQALIDYNTNTILEYYDYYAQMYGIDLETFMTLVMSYSSVEAFRELYKETAAARAKYYLIYQALAESKGIVISEDDIKAYFKEYTGSEDYSDYEEANGLPYLKAMIMYEKMSGIIVDTVTMTD